MSRISRYDRSNFSLYDHGLPQDQMVYDAEHDRLRKKIEDLLTYYKGRIANSTELIRSKNTLINELNAKLEACGSGGTTGGGSVGIQPDPVQILQSQGVPTSNIPTYGDSGPTALGMIAQSAAKRMVVVALSPIARIVPAGTGSLNIGTQSPDALVAQAMSVVQGASVKSFISGTLAADAYGVSSAATAVAGTRVFGWVFNVAAPWSNWASTPFRVSIGTAASALGVISMADPELDFYVYPFANVYEIKFAVLSVANAGNGVNSIVPGINNEVIDNALASTTSDGVTWRIAARTTNYEYSVEGLNLRDLNTIGTPGTCG